VPLVDSPKCPRCSLVGICGPDETWQHGSHEIDVLPEPLLELADVIKVELGADSYPQE